ncbi:MAG: hypothetical protein H6765_05130 [Candidatus Peribacteria bacterium]|nr:MAG: hypothetical protein H6765_05130 [Candidatus Peribacteria bacterium]
MSMYKRLSLQELSSVNTLFFANLRHLVERQRFAYFKEFVDVSLKQ